MLILIIVLLSGCHNNKDINNYINSIPILPVVKDEITLDHPTNIQDKNIDGISYSCITKTGETAKNLFDFIIFNPNVGVLFPGSIIHGSTLRNGLLTSIGAERNGGTLTLEGIIFEGFEAEEITSDSSMQALQNKYPYASSFDFLSNMKRKKYDTLRYSTNLDQISYDKVNDAVIKLVNRIQAGKLVSRIIYEKQEFHEAENDFLRLGISAKWATGKVAAAFSILNKENKSKYIIKVTQPYYDISFNQPIHGVRTPSDYFKNVKYDAFKNSMDNYIRTSGDSIDPPCYIQSVTYGRMIFIIAESNESQDSLNLTMNAVFNGVSAGGSVDLSANKSSTLKNSSFTIFSIGGSAEATIRLINAGSENMVDSLRKYLLDGANYTKDSPAYPISYGARYLKTNDVAKLGLSYKYNVPICVRNPKKVRLFKFNFITTDDDKDKEEGVSVWITKGDTKIAGGGPWGYAIDWKKNSGPEQFELLPLHNVNVNEVELNDVRLWIRKSAECGGDWGCGWHFVLNISVVFDDGTERIFNSYPGCMMGDGSDGTQVFPIIH